MNTFEKLFIVQQKLKAPKNQRNNSMGYNYRNCEDILEAVKPVLAEVKALILLSDEVVQVADRYYVKATATFIDIEGVDNNFVQNTALAREEETKRAMDASQITGASSSYARKYALNGLLAIDDTKDSDTTNVGELNPALLNEVKALNIDTNKLAEYLGKKTKELTNNDLATAIETKRKKLAEKQSQ